MTLLEIGNLTEDEARAYLESIRWPDGIICAHCGSPKVTRMEGKAHRAGAFQCNKCRQQFTVTTGGVMQDSHVPLKKWVLAFHLLCSSKKGFSALQLQRELGLGSYRTALFMLHRIREAMSEHVEWAKQGVVEMDETYVGGKPRPKDGKPHKQGPNPNKTAVVAVVERNGESHCQPVEHTDIRTLRAVAEGTISPDATLMTDEWRAYNEVGRGFKGGHYTVTHSKDEFARKTPSGLVAHTNTAESFFSLLKRGHYGVYHQMSKQHLHRYCDEFDFRWDHRKDTDAERTVSAIEGAEGKRLTYRELVDGDRKRFRS